jgi:glutamine synthetase
VLNTILADSIEWIADQLEQLLHTGLPLEEAAFAVLQQTMEAHGAVVFGGDGYSADWHRIAVEERGLENLRTSADALPVLKRPEIRALFERTGVLSPVELESRFEVYAEQYILAIEVEAKLVLRMARTQIYPAVMASLEQLAQSVVAQESLGLAVDRSQVEQIAQLSQQLLHTCQQLQSDLDAGPAGVDPHLRHCADVLLPRMAAVRAAVDGLEQLVDDALWPLPTYQELLFQR